MERDGHLSAIDVSTPSGSTSLNAITTVLRPAVGHISVKNLHIQSLACKACKYISSTLRLPIAAP